MHRNISLLIFLMLVSFQLFAQKEKVVNVNSVRGEFAVVLEYSDITGREAMQLAREDAKKKALEQVCGSRLNIWEQMESSSIGDAFNSLSISQIDGEILEFEVKEEGHKQSESRSSETLFYCIADVKVKKGLSPDPDFYVAVHDLKSIYFTNEVISFGIIPHKDCYMKIFLFEDEKTGYMIYPSMYDKNNFLKANILFDTKKSSDSDIIVTKNPDKPKEINRLMFVFTKTERPFSDQITSRAEIESWIAKIPNNQKYLHCSIIEIRDN